MLTLSLESKQKQWTKLSATLKDALLSASTIPKFAWTSFKATIRVFTRFSDGSVGWKQTDQFAEGFGGSECWVGRFDDYESDLYYYVGLI